MADMMKLAEQLGDELAEHVDTKKFVAAQKKLADNEQAQEILNAYEEQAKKMQELEQQNKPIEPEDKHKLTDLQAKLHSEDAVKAFFSAQVNYADILRKVNEKVMAKIQGMLKPSDS